MRPHKCRKSQTIRHVTEKCVLEACNTYVRQLFLMTQHAIWTSFEAGKWSHLDITSIDGFLKNQTVAKNISRTQLWKLKLKLGFSSSKRIQIWFECVINVTGLLSQTSVRHMSTFTLKNVSLSFSGLLQNVLFLFFEKYISSDQTMNSVQQAGTAFRSW